MNPQDLLFYHLFNDRYESDVNIYESENQYKFTFPAMGIKRDSISIEFDKDKKILSVKAVTKDDISHFNTIHTGFVLDTINESVKIPKPIDNDNIKATLEDGILTITLNKIVVKSEVVKINVN